MKDRCRINLAALIDLLDILLSYHATRFAILPLVLPDRKFDRPLHFNRSKGKYVHRKSSAISQLTKIPSYV